MSSETLLKTICLWTHLVHPETLPCKKEIQHSCLPLPYLRLKQGKKTALWSNKSKILILLGNHGRNILWAKKKRGNIWLVISAQFKNQYLIGFGATHAATQTTSSLAHIIKIWLHNRKDRVLNWHVCRSSIKNIWRIMKQQTQQSWPCTDEQLKSNIKQEWDISLLTTSLLSSHPFTEGC